VTGRLVRQFDLTAGGSPGHVAWDGADKQGRGLPNGIYFLRVDNSDSDDILCQKVLRIR